MLIKVSILGPEHLHEQLPTAKLDDDVEYEDELITRYKNVSQREDRSMASVSINPVVISNLHLLLLIPFVRHSLICVP